MPDRKMTVLSLKSFLIFSGSLVLASAQQPGAGRISHANWAVLERPSCKDWCSLWEVWWKICFLQRYSIFQYEPATPASHHTIKALRWWKWVHWIPVLFQGGTSSNQSFLFHLTNLSALISNQRGRKDVSLHSRTSTSPCLFAKCRLLQNSADHWCCAASWGFTASLYTPSYSGTDLLSWVTVCYKGSSVSQSVATWVESSATGPPAALKKSLSTCRSAWVTICHAAESHRAHFLHPRGTSKGSCCDNTPKTF